MKADPIKVSNDLRALLSGAHPDIKFSVKIRRYKRGYDMISVNWHFGPAEQEIKDLVHPLKLAIEGTRPAIYCTRYAF